MKTTLDQVREWHENFNAPVLDAPALPEGRRELRLSLLEEEIKELREAVEAGDMVEVLDALCDIQYVLDGAFLEFGLHLVKYTAFAEVQASNMSKLGEDGKPILREDGKILKGPNFRPPNLAQFLGQ